MSQPPRTYTNPFYTAPSAQPQPPRQQPTSPPPSYNNSTRPGNNSNEPVQYGSLSSLNNSSNGRAVPKPPTSASQFTYQPDPSRQGYRPQPAETSSTSQNRRNLPPLGREGMMPQTPPEPPRRNVSTAPVPPSQPSYLKQAQGYIPDRAQNTIGVAADRVTDGWRNIATNERKDQVMTGLGKLGAGAAKLTAKGAYQIGKFASK
ncbi:uncharacterized protein L201_005332 [Kwoniella dendrophila CBS 6074]|uniref:Uncharacterized protein n=1 Tax=Kwoniella dendrophila CBS 6074 TaxID=1295534 RepID=A0AAX4JYQ6_9TREE